MNEGFVDSALELVKATRWPIAPRWLMAILLLWVALAATWHAVASTSLCPFRSATTVPCAGCGSTRAALAILDGRPIEGFLHNPLVVMAGLVLLAGFVLRVMFGLEVVVQPPRRLRPWLWAGGALLFLANWGYVIARHV